MATYRDLFDAIGVATGGLELRSLVQALGIDPSKRDAFLARLRELARLDLIVVDAQAGGAIVMVSRYSSDPKVVNARVVTAGLRLEDEFEV